MPIKPHPNMVSFNFLECCSLNHAIRNNSEIFKNLLWIFYGSEGNKFELLGTIFENSLALGVVMDETMRALYLQIAIVEKNRLEDSEERSGCNKHTSDEHPLGLASVINKLRIPCSDN